VLNLDLDERPENPTELGRSSERLCRHRHALEQQTMAPTSARTILLLLLLGVGVGRTGTASIGRSPAPAVPQAAASASRRRSEREDILSSVESDAPQWRVTYKGRDLRALLDKQLRFGASPLHVGSKRQRWDPPVQPDANNRSQAHDGLPPADNVEGREQVAGRGSEQNDCRSETDDEDVEYRVRMKIGRLKLQAECAISADKLEEARALYGQCLEVRPNDASVLANRALVLLRLGLAQEAEEDCTVAMQFADGPQAKLFYRRALARRERGRMTQALKDALDAQELEPRSPEIARLVRRLRQQEPLLKDSKAITAEDKGLAASVQEAETKQGPSEKAKALLEWAGLAESSGSTEKGDKDPSGAGACSSPNPLRHAIQDSAGESETCQASTAELTREPKAWTYRIDRGASAPYGLTGEEALIAHARGIPLATLSQVHGMLPQEDAHQFPFPHGACAVVTDTAIVCRWPDAAMPPGAVPALYSVGSAEGGGKRLNKRAEEARGRAEVKGGRVGAAESDPFAVQLPRVDTRALHRAALNDEMGLHSTRARYSRGKAAARFWYVDAPFAALPPHVRAQESLVGALDDAVRYEHMTVESLRAICKRRLLKVSGNKQDLIGRLLRPAPDDRAPAPATVASAQSTTLHTSSLAREDSRKDHRRVADPDISTPGKAEVSQSQLVRDLGIDPCVQSASPSDSALPQSSSPFLAPHYEEEEEEEDDVPRDHDTPWTVVGKRSMQRLLSARRHKSVGSERGFDEKARSRQTTRIIPEAGKCPVRDNIRV